MGTFCLFGRLNDEDLEVKLKSLPPSPASVASSSDNAMQIFVVVESWDMATTLLDIMAAYFVFYIALRCMVFIQHYIFNIKDK